jgi:hypothetical protein
VVPSDQLSATFVAMLCVSPTVYTGLRRGVGQFLASALGGLATLAVTIPLGPGAASLSLSVALGLGAAFLFGFKTTYPVAGFTVLYVTLLGRGEAEAYFVRLASVLLGVGVSAAVNLLVSAFWYREIFARRVGIAARAVERPLGMLAEAVRRADPVRLREADEALGPVFRLLGELRDELGDLRRELRLRRGWRGVRLRAVLLQERVAQRLELIAHHARDLALILRELYREPGGAEDAASVEVGAALSEVHAALAACAARLRGEAIAIPTGVRSRYDPMLRRVAARVAEGDPEGERLELVLSVLVDIENLYAATARLVEIVLDVSPGEPARQSQAKEA